MTLLHGKAQISNKVHGYAEGTIRVPNRFSLLEDPLFLVGLEEKSLQRKDRCESLS